MRGCPTELPIVVVTDSLRGYGDLLLGFIRSFRDVTIDQKDKFFLWCYREVNAISQTLIFYV